MSFEDLKTQIDTIVNHIHEFFLQTNLEEKQNLEQIIFLLKDNFQKKNSVIESLEKEMVEKDSIYEQELKKIKTLSTKLESSNYTLKHNLDLKLQELEQQKAVELKSYLSAQKKKKNEIIHKITALKKELTLAHKENNGILQEEEKNYRMKEAEFIRRLNIDLERINSNSVNQYIDFEKSLLDTNDSKEINEAKKKINVIRLGTYKEELAIKNKYDLTIFENELEFRKFQENIILDNSIKNEEYRLKIKALEKEKNLLDLDENKTKDMMDFENERKMINFEKENYLFESQFLKDKAISIFQLQDESHQSSSKHFYNRFTAIKSIENETYDFDLKQTTQFEKISEILSHSMNCQNEFLLNKFIEIINNCKQELISILNYFWETKRANYQSFKDYLLIFSKDQAYNSKYSYMQTKNTVNSILDEHYKLQETRLQKATLLIDQVSQSFLSQIETIMTMLNNYQKENETIEIESHKRIMNTLESSYHDSIVNNALTYTENMKLINDEKLKGLNIKMSQEESSKQTVMKVSKDFETKIKSLDQKIITYLKSSKELENKEINNFKQATKISKNKIVDLRKTYSSNLVKYEKELYISYQEQVENNELERKNKIKALE